MNILVALDTFESAHKKFLIADREKILEAVDEFGLSEEDFTPINAYIDASQTHREKFSQRHLSLMKSRICKELFEFTRQ